MEVMKQHKQGYVQQLFYIDSGKIVNLAVMHRKFVCLSVIPLWSLLCCTVADPDHVWVLGP